MSCLFRHAYIICFNQVHSFHHFTSLQVKKHTHLYKILHFQFRSIKCIVRHCFGRKINPLSLEHICDALSFYRSKTLDMSIKQTSIYVSFLCLKRCGMIAYAQRERKNAVKCWKRHEIKKNYHHSSSA